MRQSGNWVIVQSLVTTTLYKLLRLIFTTVQRIYWQLNGTAQKLREARLPDNYERSAQVLDVLLVHKFCRWHTMSIDHFLCTHNRFEHPQYIADNDNITLMTINERDAIFCETERKGKHARVCNTETNKRNKLKYFQSFFMFSLLSPYRIGQTIIFSTCRLF